MIAIGLTGGYATGKSAAAKILRELGATVVDADELSRVVVRRGEPGQDEVVRAFGSGILKPDGEIDRAALGRIVFADPPRRAALEAIVHPRVIARMREARREALAAGTSIFVGEVPLLFEAGMAGEFDRVWVVSASPERQLERTISRDRLSREEAQARLASQMPLAEKERRADLVIRNDGDPACLRRQVEQAWRNLPQPPA